MASDELLTLGELTDFLKIEGDQGTLDEIRLQLLEQFERETNRVGRPFQGDEAGRVEVLDGNGCRTLYLDYPILVLTSITLGRVAPFDETLDVSDPDVVSYRVGGRRIVRTDGGVFGCAGSPGYVTVTYDAGEDLPIDAALAVKRKAAAIWRESNRPQATAERALDDTEGLPAADDVNVDWDLAVSAHRVPAV